MNIEYFKDPKWANEEHTMIDVIVKFAQFGNEIPFTATVRDTPYAAEIFNRAVAGEVGPIAEYVPPTQPESPNDSE